MKVTNIFFKLCFSDQDNGISETNLSCVRVLHESLLVPVLMHGSETMIWKEKKRYRIMPVQMNNLRGLLGIKRMHGI